MPVYVYITFCFYIFLTGYSNILLEKKNCDSRCTEIVSSFTTKKKLIASYSIYCDKHYRSCSF